MTSGAGLIGEPAHKGITLDRSRRREPITKRGALLDRQGLGSNNTLGSIDELEADHEGLLKKALNALKRLEGGLNLSLILGAIRHELGSLELVHYLLDALGGVLAGLDRGAHLVDTLVERGGVDLGTLLGRKVATNDLELDNVVGARLVGLTTHVHAHVAGLGPLGRGKALAALGLGIGLILAGTKTMLIALVRVVNDFNVLREIGVLGEGDHGVAVGTAVLEVAPQADRVNFSHVTKIELHIRAIGLPIRTENTKSRAALVAVGDVGHGALVRLDGIVTRLGPLGNHRAARRKIVRLGIRIQLPIHLSDLVVAECAIEDLRGCLVGRLIKSTAGKQNIARRQLMMEILGIVLGARNRTVDVHLENAVVLTHANHSVLGAVVHLNLTNCTNAVDIEIRHAILIDTELVRTFLPHQRAMACADHLGRHGETGLGDKGFTTRSELLGIVGKTGRAARNHHAALMEINSRSVARKSIARHVGDTRDLHFQLRALLRSLIKLDAERDAIGRALHLVGSDFLTVDGERSVALYLLIHASNKLGVTIVANRLDRRPPLIAFTLLGHADSKRLLGLKLERDLLTDGEDALVGNLRLAPALSMATLDNIVELLTLGPLHAERGVIEREIEVLGLLGVRVADGQDTLVTLKSSITVGVVDTVAVIGELDEMLIEHLHTSIERHPIDGPTTEHASIPKQVEILLVPVEELGINLILLGIEK